MKIHSILIYSNCMVLLKFEKVITLGCFKHFTDSSYFLRRMIINIGTNQIQKPLYSLSFLSTGLSRALVQIRNWISAHFRILLQLQSKIYIPWGMGTSKNGREWRQSTPENLTALQEAFAAASLGSHNCMRRQIHARAAVLSGEVW